MRSTMRQWLLAALLSLLIFVLVHFVIVVCLLLVGVFYHYFGVDCLYVIAWFLLTSLLSSLLYCLMRN